MATDRDIGAWIRRQLARYEWTAADLARRIGVSTGRLSEWMTGKRRPNPASCLKLADAFSADPDHVLALAGHRLPAQPMPPDDPKLRLIELIRRAPMTPQQINGLEAMLLAWIETGANNGTNGT